MTIEESDADARGRSAPGNAASSGAVSNGAAQRSGGTRTQLLLRLDPAVHAALAKWAADDLRSVNAQIEVVLRRALVEAGRDPKPQPMRGRGRPPREGQ